MANGLIDLTEIGPCRTRMCPNVGLRAAGSRDIEGFKERSRPGVFDDKSFYCEDCRTAAVNRVFGGTAQRTRRTIRPR